MPGARGARITAGLILISASVVSAAPATGAPLPVRFASQAVNLTADSSLLNIAHNAVNAVLNAPMAHLEGIQRFTAAMELSGSWWVYSPTNVLGWDPANPGMVKGIVDTFLPFKALSTPVGDQLNTWFAANLPMSVGCTGFPPCPDSSGILSSMFKVSWVELFTKGHTFNEPAYAHNPVSAEEGYWGQELGQFGPPVAWYGTTVKLNIADVPNSVIAYLTGTPEPVRLPTLNDVVNTYVRLAKALWNSFYPWVPTSYMWDPSASPSAYITRPFSRLLCPKCNPYDPYMPVDWKPGDPTAPGGYVPRIKKTAPPSAATPAPAVEASAASAASGAGVTDVAPVADVPATASPGTDRVARSAGAAAGKRGGQRPAASAAVKPAAAAATADAVDSPRVSRRGTGSGA